MIQHIWKQITALEYINADIWWLILSLDRKLLDINISFWFIVGVFRLQMIEVRFYNQKLSNLRGWLDDSSYVLLCYFFIAKAVKNYQFILNFFFIFLLVKVYEKLTLILVLIFLIFHLEQTIFLLLEDFINQIPSFFNYIKQIFVNSEISFYKFRLFN